MQSNQNENGETNRKSTSIDSGLMCLVSAARLLGIPAEYQ
jgi:hypothetical protein